MSLNIIFREKDIPNIREFDVYSKNGGYEALKKALSQTRKQVIDEVKASNLRGRGGAGFPTGVKWSFIPQDNPINYVVVNADESETGTFKDRQIMENNPHQMIEGALICAYAIKAAAVYIYLRGEFWDVAHALDAEIARARKAGLFGPNGKLKDADGNPFKVDIFTHLGAGAYICGEETALLNSIEGKLGQPRVRPPFPANKGGGLYNEPTVVNNVETLANVPWIINNGAEEYKKIGVGSSSGTKIFCLSGHVKNPGNYELPFGVTFRQLLYDYGGGPLNGGEFKAILPSGGSGPILRVTDEVLDTPLTYDDLRKFNSILGSASVIVMDDTVDIVWVASKVTKFFKHESCGKCTPCREGTYWLDKVLDRILAGGGKESDVDLIMSVAKNMQPTTLCAFGEFAANPTIWTINVFPEEFKAWVDGSKKPAEEKAVARPARERVAAAAAPAGD
ncbi:MAG: NADH-quinone oxidoreductase subunit NuoF [Chloroflexi bacterium]|nr:MAG: NADH-quinone oxidoreductase subunit F [Chloroflexi bacterium OLB13]MBC6956443.1 NADH-quinone oxidoreductase subunit NuoF [Chloroflexota bacterium]MBV6435058.1 NADH-quinone oxidoreductase subunit F [Anaerolineae bacterium]MDL1916032.1 NADH-quinone oxidoreductase subunit NuoF [Anaerolineae bacterium CFX4]MBW7877853.1 NADH-quinone oxidoreductase subunit NuoF [Anaerolineae bacterium]